MKIAVTYENGQIFQHFGHTEQFKLYEVADGKIVREEWCAVSYVVNLCSASAETLGHSLNELMIAQGSAVENALD